MEKKLTGLGWILCGILLALLGLSEDIRLPLLGYGPSELWHFLGLICGVAGLVLVSGGSPKEEDGGKAPRRDGPEDQE